MTKMEWSAFARKKANLSSREFNTVWKAYRTYREGGEGDGAGKASEGLKDGKKKADSAPWHVTVCAPHPLSNPAAAHPAVSARRRPRRTAKAWWAGWPIRGSLAGGPRDSRRPRRSTLSRSLCVSDGTSLCC